MKRHKPLKRRKGLRRMHPETEKNVRAYLIFKPIFLQNHPFCELHPDCFRPAAEIHHMNGHGYRGERLCDERWLRAACLEHHRYLHDHGKESRAKGLLLDTVTLNQLQQ